MANYYLPPTSVQYSPINFGGMIDDLDLQGTLAFLQKYPSPLIFVGQKPPESLLKLKPHYIITTAAPPPLLYEVTTLHNISGISQEYMQLWSHLKGTSHRQWIQIKGDLSLLMIPPIMFKLFDKPHYVVYQTEQYYGVVWTIEAARHAANLIFKETQLQKI